MVVRCGLRHSGLYWLSCLKVSAIPLASHAANAAMRAPSALTVCNTEMPHISGDRHEDHSAEIMAGLEIVDTDSGDERDHERRRTAHALMPVQAMWEGTGSNDRTEPPKRSRKTPIRTADKNPRSTPVALFSMIGLALVSAFFGWVSAAPFWLSVGHNVSGTVVVNECEASGIAPRCVGDFIPRGSDDKVPGVRVTGDVEAKRVGETVSAHAVTSQSPIVYVGDDAGLWLRWTLGLGLVVVCGFAIAAVTGSWRWHGRARLVTVLVSIAGPVAFWLGAVALTW